MNGRKLYRLFLLGFLLVLIIVLYVYTGNFKYVKHKTLSNGSKVAVLVFSDNQFKLRSGSRGEGQRVLDNLTAGHTWINPYYDPHGLGLYDQQIYDYKKDENLVFKISVQDFHGKRALYFSADAPPSNIMPILNLFDEELRFSGKIEGIVSEVDRDTIIEIIHYENGSISADEDFHKDSQSFQNFISKYEINKGINF